MSSGKFKESVLAHKYLDGLKGLEIGGSAHNDFGLDTLNVDYTDSMETTFKKAEIVTCGEAMPVDIVAEGDDVPVEDKSFDFVLNAHVIEHFFDPIKALLEWKRIARKYIFLTVPHPDRTFDKGRPLTSFAELERRHNGTLTPDDYEDQTDFGKNMRGHWTVWKPETFVHMCEQLGLKVIEVQEPDDKVGNGFSIIIDVEN